MKARALLVLAFIAFGATAWPVPSRAEQLIVSVSNHRVTVTPNYAGEELVLFGSVEHDADTIARSAPYDLVVTVNGPRADFVTRRKERELFIWANADSRQFLQVPSYLAVFANRPFDDIATPDLQRRLQLGLDHVLLTQLVGTDYADVVATDPFRRAFIRLREERGLYRQNTAGVTFLTSTLFRATIPLPAEVPIGDYEIDIKLLSGGTFVTATTATFEVVKIGFEQFVATAARQRALLYGLTIVAMALTTGWLASVIFRRD
jgi:uncharacterized protein (TIGR02186 family)